MLERWMLPYLYIQRTRLLLERIIVYEDCKWGILLIQARVNMSWW